MLNLEDRPQVLLTVPEVAARLRVNVESIRRYLRLGILPGFRMGGDRMGWRVTEEDLNRFIAEKRGQQ